MITVPRPRWDIWRSHVALITWQACGWVWKCRVCSISMSHVIAYKWVMPYINTHEWVTSRINTTHKWVMLEACNVWLHIVESYHKWSCHKLNTQVWQARLSAHVVHGLCHNYECVCCRRISWIWILWCIWFIHVAQIMLQARLSAQVQSERDNAMAQVAHLQSQVCAMTHWCVCHDTLTTAPWIVCERVMPRHNWLVCDHNCMCVMTHGCACPYLLMCVPWRGDECAMNYVRTCECLSTTGPLAITGVSVMTHFMCMQYLIDVCAMTHRLVCYESCLNVWCLSTTGALANTSMCAMIHRCVCNDLLMCVPWRIHMCALTHLCTCDASAQLEHLQSHKGVCHDSLMCVPWRIDVCVCNDAFTSVPSLVCGCANAAALLATMRS